MEAASPVIYSAAQTEQRMLEKLCARIFLIGGVGSSIASLFDGQDGLFTAWDNYGTAIISSLYFVAGLMIYLRPKWLLYAVLLAMVPTAIYQQGVMVMAVHYPSAASLYSAASAGPFFPLFFVVLFIMLPKGATTFSWIHCAGFYVQFLLGKTLLSIPVPSPERIEAEHLLVEAMMAYPVYIIALKYIVSLRERVHAAQQEAFKNKESFLGMLSHEIRNLLQTMVGAIELLELKLKDPAERRSVARLQKAATQLQTYLGDIRELTKLEDPALRIEKKRIDLALLLDDVLDEWRPQAQARGLELSVQRPDSSLPLLLETDEARLRQIVSNLVSNALKYTEKGSVTLVAGIDTGKPGSVVIEVIDTGIGIDNQYLGRIFQPYVRLENARSCCEEGSGLGLAIVERLVTSIGGTIKVESRLNQGSIFRVTVPGWVGAVM